jgi:hypothetical protein
MMAALKYQSEETNMKHLKKCLLTGALLSASAAWSHEFLTEMLVWPEDTITLDPHISYEIIDTIHLTEEELYGGVKKELVKSQMKRIVARKQQQQQQHPQQRASDPFVECDDWDGVFKTCGAFDHFNRGRAMAIDVCAGLSVSYADVFPDGLIPQFVGPETFIEGGSAAADHHDVYDFSHGLTFNCVAVISNLETE